MKGWKPSPEYLARHPEVATALRAPRKAVKAPVASPGEEALALQLRAFHVPFEREFRFDPERLWRADFAVPASRLLVEVEGGLHKGRHTSAEGYTADLEKYNAASKAGWVVLRYTTQQAMDGTAAREILEFLFRRTE